jgi:hypothetical protein
MINADAPGRPDRRGTLTVVIAGISLVFSIIACVAALLATPDDGGARSDLLPVQSKPQVASAAQVEAVAHVVLQPGTVLLSAAYSNGQETRLSAKFRLPRAGLAAFVASAKFTAPLTPGLRVVDEHDNVGGGNLWDPGTATTVSGIDEEQPFADGTHRRLLLDLDTPGVVTAYLSAVLG